MPLADPRSVVATWPTNAVAVACAKNVPAPTSARPTRTATRWGNTSNGKPAAATASAPQSVRRVPKRLTAWPASGVVTIDGRNTKYTKPSPIRESDSGSRTSTKLTYVNVPIKANRMQNPIAKAARSDGLRRCSAQIESDEHGARDVERGEDVEIRRESQVIDESGRHQASEQIARDVAGDVGGERAGRFVRGAGFAEIRQHQRE